MNNKWMHLKCSVIYVSNKSQKDAYHPLEGRVLRVFNPELGLIFFLLGTSPFPSIFFFCFTFFPDRSAVRATQGWYVPLRKKGFAEDGCYVQLFVRCISEPGDGNHTMLWVYHLHRLLVWKCPKSVREKLGAIESLRLDGQSSSGLHYEDKSGRDFV